MPRQIPIIFYLVLAIGLVVANVSVYKAIFAQPVLRVSVFEVGKGHATLLRTPRGETVLIDTGSDASILRSLGTALPFWQRDIDAVIITGDSKNQAGGLPDIEHRYKVASIIRFGTPASPPYGSNLPFESNASLTISAPNTFNISYGATSLSISSSTPAGIYISDGISLTQK